MTPSTVPSLAPFPAPAPAVARPVKTADPAQLWRAAREFESTTLAELLRPMFDTVSSKGNIFGGGQAEETWKPMLVDEIARQISAAGGLGLAAPIHAAMLKMQEGRQS
jgi:peptidoglycan hydrolase FlgJ